MSLQNNQTSNSLPDEVKKLQDNLKKVQDDNLLLTQQLRSLESSIRYFDVQSLKGFIDTITEAPTNSPQAFWDALKFYDDGAGTTRLYYYDYKNNKWCYIESTAA